MSGNYRKIKINEAIRARSGPDWNWRSGFLPDYDIWLPFEGKGTIESNGILYDVSRGDCFFLRKGSAYIADQNKDSQLKCLGIHLDFLNEDGDLIEPDTLPSFRIKLTNTDFVIALAERAVDAWRRDNPPKRNLYALQIWGQTLFHEVVTQDKQTQESGVWRGQRILLERICREFYATPEITPSVAQLAERMGCSRWQFCRIFKQHMAVTPQDYILRAKIDTAKSFLETTSMSAKQIAAKLGYTDASHFNKHFKRHTGYTPIDYRKLSRP